VADGSTWGEALRAHVGHTLIACGAGALAWWMSRPLFYWMLPVLGGLALSIPISVWTSSRRWGLRIRKAGFFLTPEETEPPPVLRELAASLRQPDPLAPIFAHEEHSGLTTAIVDPYVNAVHVSLLKPNPEGTPEALRQRGEQLLASGPMKLSTAEALEILQDPDLMLHLHLSVWAYLAGADTNWWRMHVERYRISQLVRNATASVK
jgi:membrane glycosyltransferase